MPLCWRGGKRGLKNEAKTEVDGKLRVRSPYTLFCRARETERCTQNGENELFSAKSA